MTAELPNCRIEPIEQECHHDFSESYYGWECRLCGQFYVFGLAPWENEDLNDDGFRFSDDEFEPDGDGGDS